jgi:heme/copper-type cytochrome/quinol oxidase subunit 2
VSRYIQILINLRQFYGTEGLLIFLPTSQKTDLIGNFMYLVSSFLTLVISPSVFFIVRCTHADARDSYLRKLGKSMKLTQI